MTEKDKKEKEGSDMGRLSKVSDSGCSLRLEASNKMSVALRSRCCAAERDVLQITALKWRCQDRRWHRRKKGWMELVVPQKKQKGTAAFDRRQISTPLHSSLLPVDIISPPSFTTDIYDSVRACISVSLYLRSLRFPLSCASCATTDNFPSVLRR